MMISLRNKKKKNESNKKGKLESLEIEFESRHIPHRTIVELKVKES